jgi:hypothetical protein
LQKFVRNEDPPGKGNIPGEVNEMIMKPEHHEKKKGLEDDEQVNKVPTEM